MAERRHSFTPLLPPSLPAHTLGPLSLGSEFMTTQNPQVSLNGTGSVSTASTIPNAVEASLEPLLPHFDFVSSQIRSQTDFCIAVGAHHFVNTIGMPRGNGQIERYNKTITDSRAASSASSPSEWLSHIHKVQLSINNTLNKGINATPQELLTEYRASTSAGGLSPS